MNNTTELKVRGASRKRFCVNGDPEKIIELNTTDIGIIERLRDALPKLKEIEERVYQIKADGLVADDGFTDDVNAFVDELNACDKEMRKYIDKVFDAPVSDVLSAGGTMYDPIDGEMRYLVIIADLSVAYESDLAAEMKKIAKKREQHTKKYTNKK